MWRTAWSFENPQAGSYGLEQWSEVQRWLQWPFPARATTDQRCGETQAYPNRECNLICCAFRLARIFFLEMVFFAWTTQSCLTFMCRRSGSSWGRAPYNAHWKRSELFQQCLSLKTIHCCRRRRASCVNVEVPIRTRWIFLTKEYENNLDKSNSPRALSATFDWLSSRLGEAKRGWVQEVTSWRMRRLDHRCLQNQRSFYVSNQKVHQNDIRDNLFSIFSLTFRTQLFTRSACLTVATDPPSRLTTQVYFECNTDCMGSFTGAWIDKLWKWWAAPKCFILPQPSTTCICISSNKVELGRSSALCVLIPMMKCCFCRDWTGRTATCMNI